MDRRLFIQLGAVAAGAAFAGRAAAAAPAGPAAAPGPARFALDACSRNLQWLRSPAELAKGVVDLGLKSVDLTVAAHPGHVDPIRVKTELPAFVDGLKANGIAVTTITTGIVDADSPNAEAILDAAAAAGVRHFGWGGLTYRDDAPYTAQIEASKPRVAKLAALCGKYGLQGLYQPRGGTANVGAAFFDILELLRAHDPKRLAIRYDTASLLQAAPHVMAMQLRFGGPYIGGVAINDAKVELELPEWRDGEFRGPPEQLTGGDRGGDNLGRDGGTPDAIGGGGRPLPYRFHPVRAGTGMIDLGLLGRTLKEIGFDGPAETQVAWDLAGAEKGADRITRSRAYVIGMLKHERLMIEQAFAEPWGLDIARPPFMQRRAAQPRAAEPPAGGAPD
jgi:sugar phosphate isomerase/epimerase